MYQSPQLTLEIARLQIRDRNQISANQRIVDDSRQFDARVHETANTSIRLALHRGFGMVKSLFAQAATARS